MHAPRTDAESLWDWPHRDYIAGDSLDDLMAASRIPSPLARFAPLRAVLLWWWGRGYQVVVLGFGGHTTRLLFLLELLFGRKRRYLVLLHFIPPLTVPARNGPRWALDRRRWRVRLKLLTQAALVGPVIRSSLVRAHALTSWEADRNAKHFRVPRSRLQFVPWSLQTDGTHPPLEGNRRGVVASGRAACDWPTVFAIAAGETWPLTVICGHRDIAEVRRLNQDHRATVLCDIERHQHDSLVASAEVYLLALKELEVSSGQIRVADSIRAGTAMVVTGTIGVRDYVRDGETALVIPPGDVCAGKRAVHRLLSDRELRTRLAGAARDDASARSRAEHLRAIRRMVADAIEEVRTTSSPDQSGSRR